MPSRVGSDKKAWITGPGSASPVGLDDHVVEIRQGGRIAIVVEAVQRADEITLRYSTGSRFRAR